MSLPWLLVCATKPEWGELKKICEFSVDNFVESIRLFRGTYQSTSFYLSQMGIGPKKAEEHVQQIITHLKNKIAGVIHFGVSGALVDDLNIGNLILPYVITNEKKEVTGSKASLLAMTEIFFKQNQVPFKKENLLTSSVVLGSPEQKKKIRKEFDAGIVDMESFPYAFACQSAGIPYLSIRSIWDPLGWDLTGLEKSMKADGNLSPAGLAGSLLTRPKLLLSLPKYQSATSRSTKVLAQTLSRLLPFLAQ